MPLRRTSVVAALLGAALSGAPVAALASPAPAHAWKTYTSVRYQYAICYPADLLKPQGELDAHDGQTFKAADGAEMAVFGANNVDGKSLDIAARAYARDLGGEGGHITYIAGRADWRVLSGVGPKAMFYAKTFKRNDQFLTFTLAYPAAAAPRYDLVAAAVSRCFRD